MHVSSFHSHLTHFPSPLIQSVSNRLWAWNNFLPPCCDVINCLLVWLAMSYHPGCTRLASHWPKSCHVITVYFAELDPTPFISPSIPWPVFLLSTYSGHQIFPPSQPFLDTDSRRGCVGKFLAFFREIMDSTFRFSTRSSRQSIG